MQQAAVCFAAALKAVGFALLDMKVVVLCTLPLAACHSLLCQEKKPQLSGFSEAVNFVAYEKRAAAIKPDLEAYNAAKAAQPSRALELDPMEYGKEQEVRGTACHSTPATGAGFLGMLEGPLLQLHMSQQP